MRFRLLLVLAVVCPTIARLQSADIPAHPDQLTFPPLAYQAPEPAAFRTPLKSGPIAYVVPDRSLPLVNLVVMVRAGDYRDPPGKEGLAALTGGLLASGGTRSLSADQLEERLDFLAAELDSVTAGSDTRVTLNLMAKDLDEGLGMLREVLATPRFQEDRLALDKQLLSQEMNRRNDDSATIETIERDFLAYGEDFFAARLPTAPAVAAISRADVRAFHRQWFHPANFVIAASGDFDRAELVAKLDRLFAAWPYQGETAPAVPADPKPAAPGVYLVPKEVNQGRVSILLPGIMRDDPDYVAAAVMNDILGGGGFTSRILQRIRSEEGLSYSAGSRFPGGIHHAQPFRAFCQTKSRSVAYAASIMLNEMRAIASTPVADEELETTKLGFTDRFPTLFSSKARVAEQFAEDELTGRYARQPDYWKNYRANLAAVTKDDVMRVARRWLKPDQAIILVVGDEAEILKGDPAHPVALKTLGGGRYTLLPPRDPLTLRREPIPPKLPRAEPSNIEHRTSNIQHPTSNLALNGASGQRHQVVVRVLLDNEANASSLAVSRIPPSLRGREAGCPPQPENNRHENVRIRVGIPAGAEFLRVQKSV
jgi:predicted Zn-dependent peptidase